MEKKSFPSFTKEITDRTVTGLAAIFGNVDDGGDIIQKGAFKKTIQENADRIKHLWSHSSYEPPTAVIVGLEEVGKGGLPKELKEKYPEATGGLMVTRKYLNTPRGDEILEGLREGAIKEMSFAYDPIQTDFEKIDSETEKGGRLVRILKELRLWETSDVVWGMNEATVASKGLAPFMDTGIDLEGDWEVPTLGDFMKGEELPFNDIAIAQVWGGMSPAEKERIAAHYVIGTKETETFEELLYPHHDPHKSAVGKVNLTGLREAMDGLLFDAGKDVNAGDIHEHLVKHFPKGVEFPPYSFVALMKQLRGATGYGPQPGLSEYKSIQDLPQLFEELLKQLTQAEPETIHSLEYSATRIKILQSELDLLGV